MIVLAAQPLRCGAMQENTMKNLLIGTMLVVGMSAPAFAQTSTTVTTSPGAGSSFYIVQDASTKKCTITHERPATASMTVVGGDGTIYKSESEAQSAMKTTKVCTTN
jgi:hypothetical protein